MIQLVPRQILVIIPAHGPETVKTYGITGTIRIGLKQQESDHCSHGASLPSQAPGHPPDTVRYRTLLATTRHKLCCLMF